MTRAIDYLAVGAFEAAPESKSIGAGMNILRALRPSIHDANPGELGNKLNCGPA